MSGAELVLRSRRVVLPDGERPAAVHVAGEIVAAVRPFEDVPAGADGTGSATTARPSWPPPRHNRRRSWTCGSASSSNPAYP
jgi:hypothetical protein